MEAEAGRSCSSKPILLADDCCCDTRLLPTRLLPRDIFARCSGGSPRPRSYIISAASRLSALILASVLGWNNHSSHVVFPWRRVPRSVPSSDQMRTRWSNPVEISSRLDLIADSRFTQSWACQDLSTGMRVPSDRSLGPRTWSWKDCLGLGAGGIGMVVTPLRRSRSSVSDGAAGGFCGVRPKCFIKPVMSQTFNWPDSSPVTATSLCLES